MRNSFICPSCRKPAARVIPHKQYGGLIAVRADGTRCCSENEGGFLEGGRFSRAGRWCAGTMWDNAAASRAAKAATAEVRKRRPYYGPGSALIAHLVRRYGLDEYTLMAVVQDMADAGYHAATLATHPDGGYPLSRETPDERMARFERSAA